MVEEYKVSKKVLEENKIEIKVGNYVKLDLSGGNVIEGKIVEISADDVKIVKE